MAAFLYILLLFSAKAEQDPCATLAILAARVAADQGGSLAPATRSALQSCGDASAAPQVPHGAPEPVTSTDCEQVREQWSALIATGASAMLLASSAVRCGVSMPSLSTGDSDLWSALQRTSGYGYRYHPILHRRKFHNGVDLSATYGSDIPALAAGVVSYAGPRGGYGNLVELRHPLTGLYTRYAHASQILVHEGDIVREGQVIARVGSTGLSTGPHIHVEVWKDGYPINPSPYLTNPDLLVSP